MDKDTFDRWLSELPQAESGLFRYVQMVGEYRFTTSGEQLGPSGSRAKVARATLMGPGGREVAVKYWEKPMDLWETGEGSFWKSFCNEAVRWAEFRAHPYIVSFQGPFADIYQIQPGSYVIYCGFIMELSDLGDLDTNLPKHKDYGHGLKAWVSFLLNITKAIAFAHANNWVHGDIKARNILLFEDTGIPIPKVTDFGLATDLSDPHERIAYGTPAYMAPELFDRGANFTLASDIYALGLLFIEILMGEHPYRLPSGPSPQETREFWKNLHEQQDIAWSKMDALHLPALTPLLKQMIALDPPRRVKAQYVQDTLEGLFDELNATISDPHLGAQITPDRYRWNPDVHRLLGDQLHYYLLDCPSPKANTSWLINRLQSIGLYSYSIYRVIGNHDRLLRIWCKSAYDGGLDEILSEFRDDFGGGYRRFYVSGQNNWAGGNKLSFSRHEDVVAAILEAGCRDQPVKELANLVERGLALKAPLEEQSPTPNETLRIFFFIRLQIGSDERPFPNFRRYFAERFTSELVELKDDNPTTAVSWYVGDLDYDVLVKFRLNAIQELRIVLDCFDKVSAEMKLHRITPRSQTVVEIDRYAMHESDDGSVIAAVNALWMQTRKRLHTRKELGNRGRA